MSNQSVSIVEQREVTFYGDQLVAVRADDDTIFVPVRPICERLGVSWSGQRQRINRDTILSESLTVCVTHTVQGDREMLCLPLDLLPGWLFGINENRVSDEVKEPLLRYKREVHRVLGDAFIKNKVTHAPDNIIDELLDNENDPAVMAYKTALAVANIARSHLIIQSQLETNSNRLNSLDQRMQLIEAELGNEDRFVSTSQAQQIRSAVQAIAFELGKRTGRNEFGGVWNEWQRQFDVNSYKKLPAVRYDEAMNFLSQWWQNITDTSNTPF